MHTCTGASAGQHEVKVDALTMLDQNARQILEEEKVGVLATTGKDGSPQACTCFFAVEPDDSLVFKSRSGSDHMSSIRADPLVAIGVFRRDSSYKQKAGVQLRGVVSAIESVDEMAAAVKNYSTSFEGSAEKFGAPDELVKPGAESTLFRFRPTAYKVVDGWSGRMDDVYTTI